MASQYSAAELPERLQLKQNNWIIGRSHQMPKQKHERPRLITILSVFLILQAPLIIFLGLNVLTDHWTFLYSWPDFWQAFQEAFSLVLQTPGEVATDEILFYNVLAFAVLTASAILALIAGLTFNRGGALAWIISLLAQIGTLLVGIGLYLLHRPYQTYWLLAIGVLMVLYLNYGDVRLWFLQSELADQEVAYV